MSAKLEAETFSFVPCPACNGTGSYYDLYGKLCECPMCDEAETETDWQDEALNTFTDEAINENRTSLTLFDIACDAAKAHDVAIREGNRQ
jgi:hypothetical protein